MRAAGAGPAGRVMCACIANFFLPKGILDLFFIGVARRLVHQYPRPRLRARVRPEPAVERHAAAER